MLAADAPPGAGDDRDPALAQVSTCAVRLGTAATGVPPTECFRRPVRHGNARGALETSDGRRRSLPGVSVARRARGRRRAGRGGRGDHARPRRPRRDAGRQGRRSRGTSAAATASPRWRCASSRPRLRPRPRSPTGSRSTAPCCARRRDARSRVPLPPRAGDVTPPSSPASQLDAALVDLAGKAGVTVIEGHGFDGDARRPRADHVRRRRRRPRPDRRPLRRRRRRDVEPGAQGRRPRRARLPRRVARLPPVRRRRHRTGRATTSTSGSSPTSCPATPGRSRCPAGGPTSASACCATATRRVQDMKHAVGRTSSTARTSARALGPDGDARGPPHRLADPRPRSTGRRSPRGRVLLAGDAAMASDVMTGEGIGQALLTGRLAAEAIVAAGAQPRPTRPRPPTSGRSATTSSPTTGCRRLLGRVLAHQRGARGAMAILAHAGELGPAQLRPLDVRGRAARRRCSPRRAGTAGSSPDPARSDLRQRIA